MYLLCFTCDDAFVSLYLTDAFMSLLLLASEPTAVSHTSIILENCKDLENPLYFFLRNQEM